MPTITEEPLVSTKEIAEALKVTCATVNQWVREYEDFPAIMLPGINRYRRSAVEKWLSFGQRRPKGRPKKNKKNYVTT